MIAPRSGAPVLLCACAVVSAACVDDAGPAPTKPHHARGLIVLGIDGMDPAITRDLLARGQMPNLAQLIARGGMTELDTTGPPQSPVAWSSFITGLDPGEHGIFDFIHRDPDRLEPYLSTTRTDPPDHVLELGPWSVPLDSPHLERLTGGIAFWQLLERAGVPATLVRVPANFPPVPTTSAESMSGMGTPDLLGGYGTYTVITDDPAVAGATLKGGDVRAIDFSGGARARTALIGPADPTSSSGEPMEVPIEIVRDASADAAVIQLGDHRVLLSAGEWSDWEPVAFDPGALGDTVPGAVRMHLRSVRPAFRLYVSPINADPLAPVLPLSSPERYVRDLARDIGRFYTQGMPEDTKALAAGAITPDEFLAIAHRVLDETEAMLRRELDRFDGGVLFVYASSIDLTCHMFLRSLDPDAAPEDRAHADAIPALYRRVDQWIGLIRERVGDRADLLVMSDHGFAPYRTKVHLNTWLAERGYLVVKPAAALTEDERADPLARIDWQRTRAYGLGFNQLFVNLRGREAEGSVAPGARDALIAELRRELSAFRDPATGDTVVTRIDAPPANRFPARAPDLLVGYRRGYRCSDESALGSVGSVVLEPNRDRWSGDHLMDPAAVPGVLAASLPLAAGRRPSLVDLAPTILHYFGLPPPPGARGRPVVSGR